MLNSRNRAQTTTPEPLGSHFTNELLTLEDISSLYGGSRRHTRDVITKLIGFPAPPDSFRRYQAVSEPACFIGLAGFFWCGKTTGLKAHFFALVVIKKLTPVTQMGWERRTGVLQTDRP